jgi:hypothetical protein
VGVRAVFQATLSRVVSQVEDARGAALLSYSGVLIEAVDGDGKPVEGSAIDLDYAAVLKQLTSVSEAVDMGVPTEFTLAGADETMLVRQLTPSYLVALQLGPKAITAKGHFYLRVAAPDLLREL